MNDSDSAAGVGSQGRPADTQPRVAVVVPCFREVDNVLDVLARIPAYVERIYVIDDGCPENSGSHVKAGNSDSRVSVIFHQSNRGVGGAMRTGYRQAMEDGMEIVVKVDGDGQMDPAQIARLVAPIIRDDADYCKGNRFHQLSGLTAMPRVRLLGNIVLSFISKLSTGYWQLFDPTNGFTAIDVRVLRLLPLDSIAEDYFFESDVLFRLNTLRAVVRDVPMQAIYANETSDLRVRNVTFSFARGHFVNFFKRLFYNYFLRGFSVASVEWILGPSALVFGVVFGITKWMESTATGIPATAGTVMLASLPTIVGMQMLLSAIHFDIGNEPTVPLRRLLAEGTSEPAKGTAEDI